MHIIRIYAVHRKNPYRLHLMHTVSANKTGKFGVKELAKMYPDDGENYIWLR